MYSIQFSIFVAMKTSYETYEDLLKKSLKGIEFYRKLSSTVSRLLSRLKSICNVQQEERSQLLKNHSVKSGIFFSEFQIYSAALCFLYKYFHFRNTK